MSQLSDHSSLAVIVQALASGYLPKDPGSICIAFSEGLLQQTKTS